MARSFNGQSKSNWFPQSRSFGYIVPTSVFLRQHEQEPLHRSVMVPNLSLKRSVTKRPVLKSVDNRLTVFHRPSSWLCMGYVRGKWYFVGPWIQAEHQENLTCNNKKAQEKTPIIQLADELLLQYEAVKSQRVSMKEQRRYDSAGVYVHLTPNLLAGCSRMQQNTALQLFSELHDHKTIIQSCSE